MSSFEEIFRISKLARLHLTEAEVNQFGKKMDDILQMFHRLSHIETSNVEPMYHAQDKMVLRPDNPNSKLSRESLLLNAPDQTEGAFRLPKVLGNVE